MSRTVHTLICPSSPLCAGIAILDARTIISAGIDQRLKLWQVATDELEEVGREEFDVGDCGSVCVVREALREADEERGWLVAVAGLGLQVLRLWKETRERAESL